MYVITKQPIKYILTFLREQLLISQTLPHSWCVYKQGRIALISDQHLKLVSLKASFIKVPSIQRLYRSSESSISIESPEEEYTEVVRIFYY